MQQNKNYKEFTRKCFTEYMTRSTVVVAFIRQLTLKNRNFIHNSKCKEFCTVEVFKIIESVNNTPQIQTVTD